MSPETGRIESGRNIIMKEEKGGKNRKNKEVNGKAERESRRG